MASSVINCIDDALTEVEWLVERADYINEQKMFKVLRFRLRNLRILVLSSRKLGDDDSLGPFLKRVKDIVGRNLGDDDSLGSFQERVKDTVGRNLGGDDSLGPFQERVKDMVGRNAAEIPLDLSSGSPNIRLDMRVAFAFRKDIQSLGKDVDGWYTAMMDYRQSSALVTDQVLEILSSVLLNLEDFQSFRSTILHAEILGEAMENLGEHVKFLESLICFAALISDELQQKLLARAEAVAIKFAHLLFTCRVDKFDVESGKRMLHSISMLLQMIKPVDPQVYDSYTQALINFKLSRALMAPTTKMDDDAFIAMKNFMDALISILWEILRVNSSAVDQLQELYEGLRSLRTILKQQQPHRFGMNLNEDIEVVVCDAGVLICSLHRIDLEVDLMVSNVLKTITSIPGQVGAKNASETPMFNFPRTNELGYVDFVLDKLAQLESGIAEQLQVELRFLRSYMGEVVELRSEQVELQTLWDRVLEMAYRIENLIDHLLVGNFSDSLLIDTVLEDIRAMKADVFRTFGGMQGEIKVQEGNEIYRHELSPKVPSISDDEFVGFEDQFISIRDRLIRGSKHLQIVNIGGMGGIGKTTLAAKIYNSVKYHHFHLCAWCYISQVIDKKKVLLDLLNQVDGGISSNDLGRSLRGYDASDIGDLNYMVRQRLKARKYLIVLDDIWDAKLLDELCLLLPEDYNGSRILMTSRNIDLHSRAKPHLVRLLDTDESLKLLQLKLLPQTKWLGPPLDLQMQIVEKCKGLPLTIITVAGLLANIEPMGLEGVVKDVLQCTHVFELSYKYLPDYLKPCLLYFGALPYGEEVSVRRLVRLWMAEGFVQKHNQESQENVAEGYLNNLISRSLIVVSKQRSIGGVKACHIHDLLHEFCLQKAKYEHFFHFPEGHGELSAFNEPRNLRRLCVHSEPKHFKQSKLFCPRARSLLFNMSQRVDRAEVQLDISFIIHIFKLLRVLDLQQVSLDSGLPSEIELLVQLAFLAIRGKMRLIPSSIANLLNLETLIVDAGRHVLSLPDSFWNLQKLKYVYIKSFENFGGGRMSMPNVHSSFILDVLDRFSGAVFPSWGSMKKMTKKFPNIRKLKCMLNFELGDDANNYFYKFIDLDFLRQLESLHISPYGGLPFDGMFVFSLPSSLKKLTLSHFYLTRSNISTIGELPHLEVFKLLHISFEDDTLDMKEGEFSKLRIMTLSFCLDLIRWISGDDQMFCLEKLVLNECEALKELPACLEYTSELEMIEISNCSKRLADLVRQIEEAQCDCGNSLKILIRSSKEFSVTP